MSSQLFILKNMISLVMDKWLLWALIRLYKPCKDLKLLKLNLDCKTILLGLKTEGSFHMAKIILVVWGLEALYFNLLLNKSLNLIKRKLFLFHAAFITLLLWATSVIFTVGAEDLKANLASKESKLLHLHSLLLTFINMIQTKM